MAGTWELKQRLGNPAVSWEQLIQPSVDMCFEGITVNNHAYHMMHQVFKLKRLTHNRDDQERERVMKDPGLSGTFVNPETGDIWNEGDIYTFPRLGKTLRK